jgi:hypothetical protein
MTSSIAPEFELLWVIPGGGWFAMTAMIGWANLYSQIGLLGTDYCNFTSIGSVSGGAWFTTQFMHSQKFNDAVLTYTDKERYDFILEWIDSHIKKMEETSFLEAPGCAALSPLGLVDPIEDLSIFCDLLTQNWELYISDMLRAASTTYGDSTFADRPFDNTGKLNAFGNTSHYVLMGLAENSRNVDTRELVPNVLRKRDTFLYITPTDGPNVDKGVTVPLPYLYVVEAGDNVPYFDVAVEPEALPLKIKVFESPHGRFSNKRFRIDDWEDFYLYPGTNGTVYNSMKAFEKTPLAEMELPKPFGGKVPTISQIAASTSAEVSSNSGLLPSLLAHQFSTTLFNNGSKTSVNLLARAVYNAELTYGLSVCSSWPEPCTSVTPRLIDGGYVEGLGKHSFNGKTSHAITLLIVIVVARLLRF